MARATHRLDAWLVILGLTSVVAWSVLTLNRSDLMLPAFCSAGAPWAAPLSVSFGLALVLNTPAKLAFDWALMVAAMMSPLIVVPIQHVRDRSFERRRTWATFLFASGYLVVWLGAGAVLLATVFAVRWAEPTPLVCLGLIATAAMLWQISPAKQWCLNRCHRRPHLAAFGAAADRDAFDFGLTNGAWCVGACWALMLLPLFVAQGHVLGMMAVTLFVFAERLERPAPLAWRWRGPSKALRIAAAQVRMRLVPRGRINEVSQ